MADLSPEAQAVLTAQAKARCLEEWSSVNDPPCHPSDADWNGCGICVDRGGAAAVLRAAVKQTRFPQHGDCFACDAARLLSIANELSPAPGSLQPRSAGEGEHRP
jgi:hypothetical protein